MIKATGMPELLPIEEIVDPKLKKATKKKIKSVNRKEENEVPGTSRLKVIQQKI